MPFIDRYTNTEADAGAFERATADDYDDDRPTLAELLADERPDHGTPRLRCRKGCRGTLINEAARDRHEATCAGDPWS
jgi:hypothetical protein